MSRQELLLSACSSLNGASGSKNSSVPSIHLHDLSTTAQVQSFKTSSSSRNCLAVFPSRRGQGGSVWALQEGKAMANVWAWQKDQLHLKLHLPERLTCLTASPNGIWLAAGSPSGQIYVWEVATGILLASWAGHYRAVTMLAFTSDSALLVSASQDAASHVYLMAQLLDNDSGLPHGKPAGTLGDHTLAITAVAVGLVGGASGGRCWTASEDGTVKMWSLRQSYDLLATFVLPFGVVPSALVVDPGERFLYVGSTAGAVHLIPLFHRKSQMGSVEALGGDGLGGQSIRVDAPCISLGSPVTCLTLSMAATQLAIGTEAGDIHLHSLPTHQHTRTISIHAGPISHISTMTCPPDLVGHPRRVQDWAPMEIRTLERMRTTRTPRDSHDAGILLTRKSGDPVDGLRPLAATANRSGAGPRVMKPDADLSSLQEETERLKAALLQAQKINTQMWNGIVDLKVPA